MGSPLAHRFRRRLVRNRARFRRFRVEHGLCCGCRCGCFLLGFSSSDANVFAARNALRFIGAAGDGYRDCDLDLRMERQRDLVLADCLDRRI